MGERIFGAFRNPDSGKRTLAVIVKGGHVLIQAPPVEMKVKPAQARRIADWLNEAADAAATPTPEGGG